ncbi:hypothetical protein [Vibrio cyclitrophicus]|uniref:Uncharacterized protein n=1 Tax=Vibrio sp. 1F_97 TaxID=1652827 RepID=A0A0H3ZMC7_9VIBR|nr:hypothetical protein [Vibrio cyclitrophicus]AKN37305.1 hypothetical protein [Vibrio sp. 1F_97]OEF28091.1 hypothetical protein OA9_01000 [Vibrio cyclitrophicus 1F97]
MSNSLSAKRPSRPTNKGKEDALKAAAQADDYLNGPTTSARYDLDKRLKRGLKNLSSCAVNQFGTTDKVTERMLIHEAIEDLLKKYESGDGRYALEDEFEFKR